MLLRLLLARKGHHPGTERRADAQENPEHREHAVSDSPRHHLPPVLRECSSDGDYSKRGVELTVNFGDHKRSILAGIRRERVDPKAEIEGRQALFVVDLEPRRMAGQISEGMLFDLGYADGLVPVLAVPEKPLQDGSRAG
jgi:tRNA-binding protein